MYSTNIRQIQLLFPLNFCEKTATAFAGCLQKWGKLKKRHFDQENKWKLISCNRGGATGGVGGVAPPKDSKSLIYSADLRFFAADSADKVQTVRIRYAQNMEHRLHWVLCVAHIEATVAKEGHCI